MALSLTDLQNINALLPRVNLTGNEAPAFVNTIAAVQREIRELGAKPAPVAAPAAPARKGKAK